MGPPKYYIKPWQTIFGNYASSSFKLQNVKFKIVVL